MKSKFNILGLAVGCLALALLLTQGAATQLAQETPPARTYVGTVRGTDSYVAILFDGRNAMAAVFNGDNVGLQELRGTATREGLVLVSPTGANIRAKVADDRITGTVKLSTGATHLFNAALATGDAGLYYDERTVDGVGYVAVQILLSDGSSRTQLTFINRAGEPLEINAPLPTSIFNGFGAAPAPRSKSKQTKIPPISYELQCRAAILYYQHINEIWEENGSPSSGSLADQRAAALYAVMECGLLQY